MAGRVMKFEYDENKSEGNKRKHGIDFNEAQKLFFDADSLQLVTRTIDDEERYLLIAVIDKKHWSVIFTIREYELGKLMENRVRIISVRRSRKKERDLYEEIKIESKRT